MFPKIICRPVGYRRMSVLFDAVLFIFSVFFDDISKRSVVLVICSHFGIVFLCTFLLTIWSDGPYSVTSDGQS